MALSFSGCASYQAYHARFHEPDYVVTPEFFARSPRRVAILPFASRSLKKESLERAQICRTAFYQHFSVCDFEDVDMQSIDRRLLPVEGPSPHGLLRQFATTVRRLDIVGLTSLLDLKDLLWKENRDTETFRSWVHVAGEDLQADAYVLGLVRSYGRFYAVAFSSIGLATRIELRSVRDDALLWSCDARERNVALPLTFDPLSLPVLFYDIWRNSRGAALDVLSFQVYRNVVRTLPPVRARGDVWVRADREGTRVFAYPTLWAFWPKPQVRRGTRLKFLLERRGWYQCERPDGESVWILRRDGTLVDETGHALEKTDPFSCLWKQ